MQTRGRAPQLTAVVGDEELLRPDGDVAQRNDFDLL